jgi:polyribonucleotide nucleotidyltransferase
MGLEDHIGDMDFKVAGTADGITALQMDVKSLGITPQILTEGLKDAKKARLFILDKIKSVMSSPRTTLSKYAPKVVQVKVPQEKIGEVIGPGGKIIRRIITETGVEMDVNDEGVVTISSTDQTAIDKAVAWVTGLVREVLAGEEFEGTVKRIQPFGAFVEILPGKEGLVHVSKMSTQYVSNPEDIVKIGQKVKVRVVEIDEMKRINLSMLFGADAEKESQRPQRDFHRGGFRRDNGGNRGSRPPKFFKKRF